MQGDGSPPVGTAPAGTPAVPSVPPPGGTPEGSPPGGHFPGAVGGKCPFLALLLRAQKCHRRLGAAASHKGQPRGSAPRGTSSSCRAPRGLCAPLRLPLPSPPPETPPRRVPGEPPSSRGPRAPFHLAASPGRLGSSRAVSSPLRRRGGHAAADPSNPAAKIGPDSESLAVSSRCLPTRAAGAVPALSRVLGVLGAVRPPFPAGRGAPIHPGTAPRPEPLVSPHFSPIFPQTWQFCKQSSAAHSKPRSWV